MTLSTTERIESNLRGLRKIFNFTTRTIHLENLQITGNIKCPYDITEQSRRVERALLGFLPKPLIVVPCGERVLNYPVLTYDFDGINDKYYIIDGFCEASCLTDYLFNNFKLKDLKIMTELNDSTFNNFSYGTRRRFLRSFINIIYLDWKGDDSLLKYFQS
jgi:hypothetical protein